MNYWEECINEAFDEAGITATDGQVASVAEGVEGAFENYGLAHGYEAIPNPLHDEVRTLKKRLQDERDKVHCEACNGRGSITLNFGYRSSTSGCDKCHGEGRYLP